MMKTDPILEQDILIGQYTLGLLTPEERQRLQAMLGADPAAARSALRWEETFLVLVDALPQTPPPQTLLDDVLTTLDLPFPSEYDAPVSNGHKPAVLTVTGTPVPQDTPPPPARVSTPDVPPTQDHEPSGTTQFDAAAVRPQAPHARRRTRFQAERRATLKATSDAPIASNEKHEHTAPPETVSKPSGTAPTMPSSMPTTKKRTSKTFWFGSAGIALLLVTLLTFAFMPRKPVEPPVVIVEVAPSKGAILQAPGQSSTPGWVVTIDQENNATLTPHVHTETPADASVQLWTYNKTLPQPRSLGLIDPNQSVTVPAELMGEVGENQFFEITLEPQGGSPNAEPSGPILFIGRVVTFSH